MSQWNTQRRGLHRSSGLTVGTRDSAAAVLLKVVDLCLGALIFVGPHLLGGRHVLGRFAILAICLIASVAWFTRQLVIPQATWIRTKTMGVLIAAIAWVAVQLISLPPEWIALINPRISELLPLWSHAETGLGSASWQTLSLAPEETRLALATLIAYGLLFVTAIERIETLEDIKRITRAIAYSAIIVAGFGVVQYFTSNGKFFWFYEYPYTDTLYRMKAGFTSCNHFAHFLVLGLANLLAAIMLRNHESKQHRVARRNKIVLSSQMSPDPRAVIPSIGLTVGAAIVVFAILASLSRGGILAMLVSVAVAAAVYARGAIVQTTHVVAGGVLCVVMLAALTFSGTYDQLADRMEGTTRASSHRLEAFDGRRQIWDANIAAIRASWMTGFGAGTHRFVYPLYMPEPATTEFTHAENGYLQIATENGLPGIFLLAVGIALIASDCKRAIRHGLGNTQVLILAGGITASLSASVVHSIVDFVWFIPACMTTTILLAACAVRLAQLARKSELSRRPPLATSTKWNSLLAALLLGSWTVLTLVPSARASISWDAYHFADQALSDTSLIKSTAEAIDLAELIDSQKLNSDALNTHLERFVQCDPNSALGHSRLAGALLNRFDILQADSVNSMPVNQIRESVQASQFQSAQELRSWLGRAIGENSRLLYKAHFHARRAVQLCPLQGEAYMYLAELCFLEGHGSDSFKAYSNQARLVRPFDPDVLYAIGKSDLIAGSIDDALEAFAPAYRKPGKHQREIINILAPNMTAFNFLAVFEPDWSSLEYLWHVYKTLGKPDDLQILLPYATQMAQRQSSTVRPGKLAEIYLGLSSMQRSQNQPQAVIESLQRAHEILPQDFAIRNQLGIDLLSQNQFELAETHLRWCHHQQPQNLSVQSHLKHAARGKLQSIARKSFPLSTQ